MRLGLADRYGAFLANPDPAGPATAVYTFATAAPARARVATRSSPMSALIWAALGLVGLAAGLVWWARS